MEETVGDGDTRRGTMHHDQNMSLEEDEKIPNIICFFSKNNLPTAIS